MDAVNRKWKEEEDGRVRVELRIVELEKELVAQELAKKVIYLF